MEPLFFLFLFLFSVLPCPSSAAPLRRLHHESQTLLPRPLSSSVVSSSLSWPDEPPETSTAASPLLQLHLHPVDTLFSLSSNLSLPPQSLLRLRLHRDASRVSSLAALSNSSSPGFSSSIISGLAQGSGEYFTRIGIGTPPRYLYMVLDTGSDVLWLQCSPCRSCYNQADPIFNPSRSSSFSPIPCSSPLCRRLDSPGCNARLQTCLYQVSYGDGSFTLGEFAAETLTFHRTRVGPVALGCGHDNEGLFVGAAGLLGLGRGRLSFPSQAGTQFNKKFSYCLVDRSASSRPSTVIFGGLTASPRTIHFTPLLSNPKLDTFYYVELLGISVGGTRVAGISASLFQMDREGNGGVIVDSGTSVTRLTRPAYVALRDAFRVRAGGLKRGPNFSLFDTCYDLLGKTEVKVPTVVLHMRGADVSLPASNYLIPVDSGGTFCFAFAGTMSGLSIIGNIQQQGFRVIFDLGESRVGFVPRGCA